MGDVRGKDDRLDLYDQPVEDLIKIVRSLFHVR